MGDRAVATIPERLRAACRGHPAAHIPWPHRLLHEAADRIEALEAIAEEVLDRARIEDDPALLRAAAAALGRPNGDEVRG